MSIKQTIRSFVLGVLFIASVFSAALVPVAGTTLAQGNNGCETDTAIIKCDKREPCPPGEDGCVQNTGLWSILLTAINILTAGVGVLALAGIVYGSILYTSAGGSAEQIKKAKTVFTNVVIGVIAFGGMYALLNFIVPGGVFN